MKERTHRPSARVGSRERSDARPRGPLQGFRPYASPSARQQGAANAAPCLPPLQVRDRRNNVTRPRLRRTAAVPSPLPAAPYESLTFRQSEDKGASCALSSCLGLYLKPHPFTFRQRQRGVKQRPAVFLCCGMGICKRSATVCKIEVPGPCGPDTPNVCKKPFCVCKIDK